VTRCEQCGAEAVSADGVCGNCGWQSPAAVEAPEAAADELGSSPSLGETRAAAIPDIPDLPAPQPATRSGAPAAAAAPALERTVDLPRYAPPARPAGSRAPTTTGTPARFCGTCGARITGNEAFCGQCGTPVSASMADAGTAFRAPATGTARFRSDADSPWQPADGDAPTEAFLPPVSAYGRGSRPTAYPMDGGYPAGRAPETSGSGRSVRIVLGILCLVGSLASAAGALLLALQPR
jgi:hypothetical protein